METKNRSILCLPLVNVLFGSRARRGRRLGFRSSMFLLSDSSQSPRERMEDSAKGIPPEKGSLELRTDFNATPGCCDLFAGGHSQVAGPVVEERRILSLFSFFLPFHLVRPLDSRESRSAKIGDVVHSCC